jgi:hypothetical protein
MPVDGCNQRNAEISGLNRIAWISTDADEWENGAAYVTRTRDPRITNAVLYQLS